MIPARPAAAPANLPAHMAGDYPLSGNLAHEGVILSREEVAPRCWRLAIRAPAVAATVRPGQFVMLRARQGMDPFLSRAFSVSDLLFDSPGGAGPSPTPTGFTVLILVVGVGTQALSERQPGEAIGILGPLGRPYDLGSTNETMLLVAGGVGAAPFALVARALRARSTTQPVHYLVGGRSKDFVYLADEIAALGVNVHVATDDGSRGHKGYVTQLLEPMLADGVRILSCGPNPMFAALAKVVARARERGLRFPCEVSTEETMPCGFGACAGCVVPVACETTPATPDGFRYAKSCIEGPVFPVEAIRWDLLRSIH